MITCRHAIALLVTMYFSGAWATADLPPESEELMQKLSQFAEEKSAESEVRIMEKRVALATILEDLLGEETKRGNLDEANAINNSKGMLKDLANSSSAIMEAHPKLPRSSRSYLEKLEKLEQDEKASVNEEVRKKGEAVAKVLEDHLDSITQKGNLNGANAILATIKKLRSSEGIIEAAETDTPEIAADIPEDAIRYKGHQYKIFKTESPINWESARDECRKMGGELGWTPEEDDIQMLKSILQPFVNTHGHSCIWVGGKRNKSGEWEWLDGTKVDESIWQENENSRFEESCTVMIRWIASFRGSPETSARPVGYLCRWE